MDTVKEKKAISPMSLFVQLALKNIVVVMCISRMPQNFIEKQ